jgi:SLOG-like protein
MQSVLPPSECRPTGQVTRDALTGVQIRIGVMGSAGGPDAGEVVSVCRELGRAIAEAGCCLLTGACPGLPHEAVVGAKESAGTSSGSHRPPHCVRTSMSKTRPTLSTTSLSSPVSV